MPHVSLSTNQSLIVSPRYGEYVQTVHDDIFQAGHIQLASGGKYGWGMPADPPTREFVLATENQTILEVGTGVGQETVIPILSQSSAEVYATDISSTHLDSESPMRIHAAQTGKQALLHTVTINPTWWDADLLTQPTLRQILLANPHDKLPPDASVDAIMSRHVLQFGDPGTVLRFFDLASAALKLEGVATAINFTQYTEYMYQYDSGEAMSSITSHNERFAADKSDVPGGYMHSERGPLKISLAELMGKAELDRGNENRFLYFDHLTLRGLLRVWASTREMRGLPVDLVIVEGNYFAPPSIAKVNKLTSDISHMNMENFVFTLRKILPK